MARTLTNYALASEGISSVVASRSGHGADGQVVSGVAANIIDGDYGTHYSQWSHDGGYATIDAEINFSSPIQHVESFLWRVRGARTTQQFSIKTVSVPAWTLLNSTLVSYGQYSNLTVVGEWENVTNIKIHLRSNSDNDPYCLPYGVGLHEVEVWGYTYIDIGIRNYNGSTIEKVGVYPLPVDPTDKLRIYKSGNIYGIPLIDTSKSYASNIRIYDGSSVKSLPVID